MFGEELEGSWRWRMRGDDAAGNSRWKRGDVAEEEEEEQWGMGGHGGH